MATLLYTPKENGDLKLMAEIDEDMDGGEAVDLFLEQAPRTKADSFVIILGDLEEGAVSTVTKQETVTLAWVSSRNGDDAEEAPAPRRGGRRRAAPVEEEPEEAAPKPARRRRNTGKAASTRKPAAKKATTSRRRTAAKPSAKKTTTRRGGGFKRNAASDE